MRAMDKEKELKTATEIVKDILENDPTARNSDDYLYYMVCSRIDGISVHLPFWKVLLNRKQYKYPAFESVRRIRQKMQEKYPELAGNHKVEKRREENEEVFRRYVRGEVNG